MTKDAQLGQQIKELLDASDLPLSHKRGILNGLAADLRQKERESPDIEAWRSKRKPILKPSEKGKK